MPQLLRVGLRTLYIKEGRKDPYKRMQYDRSSGEKTRGLTGAFDHRMTGASNVVDNGEFRRGVGSQRTHIFSSAPFSPVFGPDAVVDPRRKWDEMEDLVDKDGIRVKEWVQTSPTPHMSFPT